jgi:phage I-like protein
MRSIVKRTLAAESADLPTEFRLFAVGSNGSTSGPSLWDEKAAASVLAHAKERAGVRYVIDLEHRSLDDQARALTKDATDAMGWFDLEVRNGELWAVNLSWGEEGAERLRSKRQVYFSPAFYTDEEGRVTEIVNVALTSMPATHGLAPLVAASRRENTDGARRARRVAIAIAERKLARMQRACQRNTRKP